MTKHRIKSRVQSRKGNPLDTKQDGPLDIHPNCDSPPYITYNKAVTIDPQHRFIFLWIPKVAGMSISQALKIHFGQTYLSLENTPTQWNTHIKGVTFYHSHVPALVEKGHLPAAWVDQAFKFAFVRNPWDRMVSLYHWLQWGKVMNFHQFIQAVATGNYDRPGATNLRGFYQANRLIDWLRPNGIWLPQFIGRFENLQEDWKIVMKILGCKCRLKHRNTSKHTHYRDYYDATTRALVAKHFEEDIDLFKYTFED